MFDEIFVLMVDVFDFIIFIEQVYTLSVSWYMDARVADLEKKTVWNNYWIFVVCVDQLMFVGAFVVS